MRRRPEVLGAERAAGVLLLAGGALDHPDVTLAPLLHPFVEVDRGPRGVDAIAPVARDLPSPQSILLDRHSSSS